MSHSDEYDLGDVPTDELQEEYQDLGQQAYDSLGHPDAIDYDQFQAIGDELEARHYPDYPECPRCGGTEWGQTPDDPIRCLDCRRELREGDEELRNAIHDEWSRIFSPDGGSA